MTTTTLSYVDLPDAQRMAYLDAIDAAGGNMEAYDGPSVLVAIPCPSGPFYRALEAAGLSLVPASLHYFPLGTDKPPMPLRHDGRYPGSKGFWLFGRFVPHS